MFKLLLIPTLLALAPAAGQALTCEALQAQIDAKIRANGVTHFSLATIEASASAPGREVGRCDLGNRKILYRQAPADDGGKAPAKPADRILTECKDGTVSIGGSCRK